MWALRVWPSEQLQDSLSHFPHIVALNSHSLFHILFFKLSSLSLSLSMCELICNINHRSWLKRQSFICPNYTSSNIIVPRQTYTYLFHYQTNTLKVLYKSTKIAFHLTIGRNYIVFKLDNAYQNHLLHVCLRNEILTNLS